jgi:hypothetical protein
MATPGLQYETIVVLKENRPYLDSELVDETSSTWKEDLIRQYFLPKDR